MSPPSNTGRFITPQSKVGGLLDLARHTLDGTMSAREEAGLLRLEQTIARRTLRAGNKKTWAYGFGLAAAAACAVVALTTLHPLGTALTYQVVGGEVGDGGYVRASRTAPAEIQFSDGSHLALDPGTSTRVTEVGPNGSRVFLESGHARVHVTHRPRARWTVEAGPYSIRVVGTEFDVQWSATEEMFDVQLHKGAIIVSGPLASRGLAMDAGQRLVANVKQGEIFLDRGPAAGGADSSGAARTSAEGSSADEGATSPAPDAEAVRPEAPGRGVWGDAEPRARPRGGHGRLTLPSIGASATERGGLSWSRRVAIGDFRSVLADAERRGLDATLGTAPVDDLAALADAARYVRHGQVARRALLAERNRFPKSREAREAAFFLGGLSEDDPGAEASTEALTWYDRYLDESPKGAYAAHALGREMTLVHKLRGPDAARPFADRYLERFPDGPYAASARALISKP
jgi:hypothetical protein